MVTYIRMLTRAMIATRLTRPHTIRRWTRFGFRIRWSNAATASFGIAKDIIPKMNEIMFHMRASSADLDSRLVLC